MLTATFTNLKTLGQFYSSIRSQQEDAKNHGAQYCAHHDMIAKYIGECKSYKELGTHQGASAAAAILAGVKEVHLVDQTLEKFNTQKHLFEHYCNENGVLLHVYEMSSIDAKCAISTDMLMIDSLHKWSWTSKELEIHAPVTNKYIIFHDTSIVNKHPSDIGPGIKKWCVKNGWDVIDECKDNVGAITIKRRTI